MLRIGHSAKQLRQCGGERNRIDASKTLPRRAIDIASGIIDNGSASLQARAQSFQIDSIVA